MASVGKNLYYWILPCAQHNTQGFIFKSSNPQSNPERQASSIPIFQKRKWRLRDMKSKASFKTLCQRHPSGEGGAWTSIQSLDIAIHELSTRGAGRGLSTKGRDVVQSPTQHGPSLWKEPVQWGQNPAHGKQDFCSVHQLLPDQSQM